MKKILSIIVIISTTLLMNSSQEITTNEVKELNLRIGALNTLHRDVFGDDSMQNIESMS